MNYKVIYADGSAIYEGKFKGLKIWKTLKGVKEYLQKYKHRQREGIILEINNSTGEEKQLDLLSTI